MFSLHPPSHIQIVFTPFISDVCLFPDSLYHCVCVCCCSSLSTLINEGVCVCVCGRRPEQPLQWTRCVWDGDQGSAFDRGLLATLNWLSWQRWGVVQLLTQACVCWENTVNHCYSLHYNEFGWSSHACHCLSWPFDLWEGGSGRLAANEQLTISQSCLIWSTG